MQSERSVVPEMTFLTSFLFDEFSVLVSLWLDWAFISAARDQQYPGRRRSVGPFPSEYALVQHS